MTSGAARASSFGALGLAALGSALWVEHRSRAVERRHQAPHQLIYIGGTRLHYRLVGEGPPVLLCMATWWMAPTSRPAGWWGNWPVGTRCW